MDIKSIAALKRFQAEKMTKVSIFDTAHCFLDVYCFEPGQQQKLHSHDDADKIYYVLEGSGQFQVGEAQADLSAGQTVLAPAGQPHGVTNNSGEKLVLLTFMAPNPNRAK